MLLSGNHIYTCNWLSYGMFSNSLYIVFRSGRLGNMNQYVFLQINVEVHMCF